jgi:hypothetical protein
MAWPKPRLEPKVLHLCKNALQYPRSFEGIKSDLKLPLVISNYICRVPNVFKTSTWIRSGPFVSVRRNLGAVVPLMSLSGFFGGQELAAEAALVPNGLDRFDVGGVAVLDVARRALELAFAKLANDVLKLHLVALAPHQKNATK